MVTAEVTEARKSIQQGQKDLLMNRCGGGGHTQHKEVVPQDLVNFRSTPSSQLNGSSWGKPALASLTGKVSCETAVSPGPPLHTLYSAHSFPGQH